MPSRILIERYLIPAAILLLSIALGFVLRAILFRGLRKWKSRDVLIPALRGPIIIWSVILGADLALRHSVLPARYVHEIDTALIALWVISLTLIAATVSGTLVHFYIGSAATLTRNLAQIVVYLFGLMFLLNHVGVDVRPLLTALGVTGLAVALALQDTLSNLFAGFYISLAGQLQLGDYIKLNSGEEGYITDITWRSTALKTLGNTLIFIPNNKLAQANVTNFNLPDLKLGMSITIKVAFDADLPRIEQILLEEAKPRIEGLVPESPSVQTGFGDYSLVMSLNYQVETFVAQYGVASELRRRIQQRFLRENIAMPSSYALPTRPLA